ncbi:MAG: CAP domain-containing protein [Candidatus Saccharibacteria bacterium]|nr:CAP domain-containing protein [Candidatus Saccharibacteria bacterium]
MASGLLKQSRSTILWSINAAAILIAGILVSSAIWLNGGIEFRVVGERSDVVEDAAGEMALLESVSNSDAEIDNSTISDLDNLDYVSTTSHEFDSTAVATGELWNEKSIVIYATPDTDICVGGALSDLGDMYWQTSNQDVITGFYDGARTWLGYSSDTCRYPVISGIGTTTVTAGTYDGKRKDSITVTVVEPPVDQWEHEVLTLVNKIRVKNGLSQLAWSDACDSAALTRAKETIKNYAHTRPDGSSWATACPVPASGGTSGENLAVGNAAVSPATVVALWMGSESHRANILNSDYTNLSVGFVFDLNTNYKTHWSQIFSTY